MPTNTNLTHRYYPALSEIITVDDLPEFLHFAEQGLEALLGNIHFKNLQYARSKRGDSAFYSLDIVGNNIEIGLPFGLRLVLNPDEGGDSSISSFPISLQYQWELLAYIRAFKLTNFAWTPQAFYELGLQLFKLTDGEVIAHILNEFFPSDEDINDKFEEMVDDINDLHPTANLELPIGEEPTANLLARLIRENTQIPDTVPLLMFGLYIVSTDLSVLRQNVQHFFQIIMPSGIEDYIRSLLVPKVRATLTLSAGIEFPTSILQPVEEDGTPIPDSKTVFKFLDATFYADTEGGIGTEIELTGDLLPGPSQIGNTGFIIEFTKAKLDLSRKRNIPEADLAGYGPDFVGLYVKRASVRYIGLGTEDEDEQHQSIALIADDLLVGTGGLSGRITMESQGVLYRKFGNFAAELNRFSVQFNKGKISSSDIAGALTIPGFRLVKEDEEEEGPAIINIEASIRDNGDFTLTAQPRTGFFPITLPNVLKLNIRTLKLGREQRGFYIEVSGRLDFIANIPGLGEILPKNIDIERFRIWDNGDLEFEGGSFIIPRSFHLKVGPVNMEISQISFGSYTRNLNGVERRYRYFGFDGMINTGRAGVSASGDGIKYYFTVDNEEGKPFDSFTSIDAISIDLVIPGNVSQEKAAFILNGYLSMSNPDPNITDSVARVEYTGAVSFSLPRLRLSGSAAMRLNPKTPAFLVDIGLELPVPIPLGPTGLGIYGFRGLIGQHYLPSKSAAGLLESATWWEYYKKRSSITGSEGIEIDKFDKEKPGFSVGAGASLATAYDKGFTFSTKIFLLLGLPDVFLLQGQAGILRTRLGLSRDVDPPFSVLISISDRSFMTNLSVNYRLPEGGSFDGDILRIGGTMELAFFFNNASGWYINLGKDQPESARIQARVLSLFNGYAYLMISSRGIKSGAGARFDFNKKFGPVGFGIGAFIDIMGSLSFRPIQIGGRIQFGGYAYLRIWKFKLGLSVKVILGFEAPNPFSIYGALEVTIKLPWPFKNIRFTLAVGWTFNSYDTPLHQPIDILRLPSVAEGYNPAAAVNILSGDVFPINYVMQVGSGPNPILPNPGTTGWRYNFNHQQEVKNVTIPLDSFIDIDLLNPVKPGNSNRLGGSSNQLANGYVEMVPAQKGLSNQYRHEFEFLGIDIYCWTGSGWQPYHVYEAVTALVNENNESVNPIDLSRLKDGYWQFDQPNRFNKIRLLSQNMFTMASEHTSVAVDMDGLNYKRKDLFCFETIMQLVHRYVDPAALFGTLYPTGLRARSNQTGTVQKYRGQELYDSIVSKFATRNVVYLDIRNDSGYAYNFYGKYGDGQGNDVQITDANDNTQSLTYGTGGWPVQTLDGGTTDFGKVGLSLRIDHNEHPVLFAEYIQVGNVYDRQFTNSEALVSGSTGGWTNRIDFTFPRVTQGTGTVNVAQYLGMQYFEPGNRANPAEIDVYYNNAFCAAGLADVNGSDSPLTFAVQTEPVYVHGQLSIDEQSLVSRPLTARAQLSDSYGFSYAGDAGVNWDENQVVFYARSVYTEERSGIEDSDYTPSKGEGMTLGGGINAQSFLVRDLFLYKIEIQEDLGNNEYHQVSLLNIHHNGARREGYEDTIFLGITKSEYSTLIGSTGLSEYHHSYPYLERVGEGPQEDRQGIKYYKYRLGMIGIDSNRDWSISFPPQSIYTYSRHVDDFALASAGYAENTTAYDFPSIGKAILDSLLARFKEYPQEIGLMSWGANEIYNNEITWEEFENWFMGESEGQDGVVDESFVKGPRIRMQRQSLPSLDMFIQFFPKKVLPNDQIEQMPAEQVYSLVGGNMDVQNKASNPNYQNACAIRASYSLNRCGKIIPIYPPSGPQKTEKGSDNYNYIIQAAVFNKYMRETFGPATYILDNIGNDPSKITKFLKGKTGIYTLKTKNATLARYSGHVDLIYDGQCLSGAAANPKGGVEFIEIWELN